MQPRVMSLTKAIAGQQKKNKTKNTRTKSVLLTGDLLRTWLPCKYDFFTNNVYFSYFFSLPPWFRYPA